jgi:hypothetical protein
MAALGPTDSSVQYEIRAALFGISHTKRESNLSFPPNVDVGRTVTQAVNRRLPSAAARVRARVKSSGICG